MDVKVGENIYILQKKKISVHQDNATSHIAQKIIENHQRLQNYEFIIIIPFYLFDNAKNN